MATVISLGPNCVAATLLDRLGMRPAAFPFDWLYSSIEMVEHCLDDDFAAFLDPAQHEPISHKSSDHRLYRDRFGVTSVFNHHGMPGALDHFERAVARFRTAEDPVFLHIAVARAPEAACLRRVRAKLHGPLLAYVLKPQGIKVTPAEGVQVTPLPGAWDADAFPVQADAIGFTAQLVQDIARAHAPAMTPV